jgi:hypothetical protein
MQIPSFARPFVLLALPLTAAACGAAAAAGVSANLDREFEISNKSKEDVCEVDVVNNVVVAHNATNNIHNVKVAVKAGETKVEKISVAVDQDRVLRFKSCKGTVLKEQNFVYSDAKAHVDIP